MKKMQRILRLILPVLICGVVVTAGVANAASAAAYTYDPSFYAIRCDGCPEDLFGPNGVFKQISNTVLYIVGIVAIIMLIIGGIRYVVSGGDAKKVTDAKNTILYALIGLVVCFLAFAIVNFVVTALPSSDMQETLNSAS